MKKRTAKAFVNYLQKNKLIEKFNTGFSDSYRLASEFTCIMDSEKISYLKEEYTPGIEKGGIFLLEPIIENGRKLLITKEIIFIKNVHSSPEGHYLADKNKVDDVRKHAFENSLLPFDFHSHPTKAENILYENLKYQHQLDTSPADKLCSFFGIKLENIYLRLPDILVVSNGRLKSGLFVGFYGGLVAPLDFTERKKYLADDMAKRSIEGIRDFLDTPEKKIGAVITAAALLFIFIKYPKLFFYSSVTAATILPVIAYSTGEQKEYFGISNGEGLEIILPKNNDELVREDERAIHHLLEEWKRKNLSK